MASTAPEPSSPDYVSLDFAVIGFQKCGTCSLRRWLQSFPGVRLPDWEWGAGVLATDRPPAGFQPPPLGELAPGELRGTVHPSFCLGDVETHARGLRALHPETRLIVIERDPVQRAASAWAMFSAVEGWNEQRSFEGAIEDCLARPDSERMIDEYVSAGEYGRCVRAYRAQGFSVLRLSLDRMIASAVEREVCADYLGLDPSEAARRPFPHENRAVRAKDITPHAEYLLRRHYALRD